MDFSWIFYWCQILPMFCVIFGSIFFMKLKKNIQRSKHVCNFQHKFIGSQMADNNNKLALARWDFLGYLAIRWLSTKIKVCFEIRIKNDIIFVNTLFWNFDISEKKSADFSCLFTFFTKNENFKISSITNWEFHNCLIKILFCLNLCFTT